ncbi:MAG: efflux RND transporter permease subunit [Spirochaetales bacterium]|nr:efflux RND transporter permease subunit [Spirochaetales bacterium]
MKKVIEYFANKPIFTNFLVIAVFVGAVIFWFQTGKEEMPNITFDFMMVSANYTGASPEDIEYYVTAEIEDALTGINGIRTIRSTTTTGNCRIFVELEPNNPDRQETIDEIKEAVDKLQFPEEVEDTVRVNEFKSSNRSVLDVILYNDEAEILSEKQRRELQAMADLFSERLIRLSMVSEVSVSADLEDKIDINVIPEKLSEYEISLSEILAQLKSYNIRQPVGTLDNIDETRVTYLAEINDLDDIRNIIIRSGFEGQRLYLKDVAVVSRIFTEQSSIYKVNGHEAVRLNVVKTTNAGIIEAVDQIKEVVTEFTSTTLKDSLIKVVLMDDESSSVRDRLTLIVSNGLLGFLLLITLLFIFLNFKSGLWVAMGIPFTFSVTMIFASLLGHTINNMTLAAVIIVMGMVVDDAIVVAENVSRLKSLGVSTGKAVVEGTSLVLVPIVASITTTCAAFIPLFFFEGRFGMMTKYLPPIIFLMLGASLFEAVIILPSHLKHNFPRWVRILFSLGTICIIERIRKKRGTGPEKKVTQADNNSNKAHWFFAVEDVYGRFLAWILRKKTIVLILFIGLLVLSIFLVKQMKYVLFPDEETTEVMLIGSTKEGMKKYETEKKVREIEAMLLPYVGKEVVGITTSIARGRRDGSENEHRFVVFLDIVSKEKRKKSANELIADWEAQLDELEGFDELSFAKSRFGQSSGSPIDIIIQERNPERQKDIASEILEVMERVPALINAEIERSPSESEIKIYTDPELLGKLDVKPETIASTLKIILIGARVYIFQEENKDIDVTLTIEQEVKQNIERVLQIPVQNASRYLIPLKDLTWLQRIESPNAINRLDGLRVLHVYADLKEKTDAMEKNTATSGTPSPEELKTLMQKAREGDEDARKELERLRREGVIEMPMRPDGTARQAGESETGAPEREMLDLPEIMTPLEVADYFEKNVFPELHRKYPGAQISFSGEVEETRESGNQFLIAIILIVVLIYVILALSLNSLAKPVIIMLSIPFGFIGIILAFQAHGIVVYGFFSIVGALGLAGVVVNDSIVMLDKLVREYGKDTTNDRPSLKVARIAKTRLRAVLLTTATTVAGVMPTAYGIFGYDSMLSEMMLALSWGLIFGTMITLLLVPSLYCFTKEAALFFNQLRIPLTAVKGDAHS